MKLQVPTVTRFGRSATALSLLSVLALGLSACGNTDPVAAQQPSGEASAAESATDGASGSLAGAGASSQESAMNTWRAGFQSANPNFTVTYDAVGSGAGIEQFLSGQVSFAGSDEALGEEELAKSAEVCAGGKAIDIPAYISPVAVVFNLEGVQTLNLSAAQIADIFNGKITKWNDPSIVEANPDVELPDLAITPVHRADKSGTTENFTAYLNAVAPDNWSYEPSKEWPVAGGESGDKTSGLIQTVTAGQGTIGYADASQAGSLGTVALKVGESYVKFSPEAAGKAVAAAAPVAGREANDLALDLDYATTAEGAYPMILVSYLIGCQKYEDADTAANVSKFLSYIVSEEAQNAAAEAAGSVPLPAEIATKAKVAAVSIAG